MQTKITVKTKVKNGAFFESGIRKLYAVKQFFSFLKIILINANT